MEQRLAQVAPHAYVQLVVELPEVAAESVERLRLGAELYVDAVRSLRNLGDRGGHVGRQVVDRDGVTADRDEVREVSDREVGILAQHVVGTDFGAAGTAGGGLGDAA